MKEYKIYRILLGEETAHSSDDNISDFQSARELLEIQPEPGIVLLDGLKGKKTSDRLKVFWELVELRESVEFCCAPIYLSRTMQQIDILVDGITGNIEERLPEAISILEKSVRISRDKLQDNHNLRMLAFMYVRGEEYSLSPVCSPFSQWIYSYPHMALLLDSSTKASKILRPEDLSGLERLRSFRFDTEMIMALRAVSFLEDHGYIAQDALVDRVRKCPKCNTGHLNYVDICPNCGSIDFNKKLMIHCFTCGHVAPDSDFRKNMSFVCPKCNTVLRHLGSDYDHPLESHECNNCGSKFIEPDVKADCLFCKTRSVPSDLTVVNIYSYKLSEKGSAAVRTGTMQMEVQLFDGRNNLKFNYFCSIVEWMREYRKRYSDEIFTMIGIKFSNLYEVETSVGEELYNKIMDEIIFRIRSMVRTTDITTSSAPDTFWILLPRTIFDNSKILAERIEQLNNMLEIKSENKIEITAKCFQIPTDESDMSAEKYLELFAEQL